jgi:hypothetical protein
MARLGLRPVRETTCQGRASGRSYRILSFAKTVSDSLGEGPYSSARAKTRRPQEVGLSTVGSLRPSAFPGKTKVLMWRTEAVRREEWGRSSAVVAVRTGQPVLDYAARRTYR